MAHEITAVDSYVEQFEALKGELPGGGHEWLGELREAAMARFVTLGFPTRRSEAWKYTDLRPLQKVPFLPARGTDAAVSIDRMPALLPTDLRRYRLVFVNGGFRPELSNLSDLPSGVEVGSLGAALTKTPDEVAERIGKLGELDGMPMLALNTALMCDGLMLRVRAGVMPEGPIEAIFIGAPADTPVAYHPRNLLVLEPGSQATLVEHHVGIGAGPYFANGVTDIIAEERAHLRHYKVQAEGADAFHIATVRGSLGKDAVYDGFGLSLGARLSRNEMELRLDGPGAECRLNGAYLMRGQQHCDTTTVIEHREPHARCRETFKGVLDDRSRAVFQGRIVVHPGAQGTDAHQLSRTLLLSDRAEIDTKPELEIYADDVKCSHGATVGDLDHDAMFYLRSRGIAEAQARKVLIEAFLGEVLEEISAERIRDAFSARAAEWLGTA